MKKQLLWQNSFIFLPPYVLGNIYLPSVGSFDQCVQYILCVDKASASPHHCDTEIIFLLCTITFLLSRQKGRKPVIVMETFLLSGAFLLYFRMRHYWTEWCPVCAWNLRFGWITYIKNKQNLEKVMILPEMKQGSPNCPNTTADGMVFCTNHNISVSERYLCIGIQ